MKINVLGTEYTLTVCGENEDLRLTGFDGLTDETTKELLVESYEKDRDDPNCKKNLQVQINKVKRHEIIHAFLFESGLAENSTWAQNEEMIDFFAIQFPKLLEAFKAADAL
nr:MAG TPA: hypothetical protein [Caudoviricetes sp.]